MPIRIAIFCLALAGLSFPTTAMGSVESLMAHATRELRKAGAPGVSIVVVLHGKAFYANAGSSNRAGAPVTENTIFETASISKIFTTTLLGIDAARGKRSIHALITHYLHRRLTPQMRHVTLEMLATYTAGIPNLPPVLTHRPSTEWGLDAYPLENFLKFVSHLHPRSLPAPVDYSDSSVGLLGLCLGNLNPDTWESLQKENLYFPLGMRDTAARLDAEQESRLAEGETPDGSLAARWPFDAFVAADGVKSTTHDLGNFLAAEIGRRAGVPKGITAGMAIATKPKFTIAGGTVLQAMSWTWEPGEVHGKPIWIIMKGGNLVGFSSRICFNRNLEIGVAILTNHPNMPTQEVATELLERIAQQEYPASSISPER